MPRKFDLLVEQLSPQEEDPIHANIKNIISEVNQLDPGQFEAFFVELAQSVEQNQGKEGNVDLSALIPKLKECADVVASAAGL